MKSSLEIYSKSIYHISIPVTFTYDIDVFIHVTAFTFINPRPNSIRFLWNSMIRHRINRPLCTLIELSE